MSRASRLWVLSMTLLAFAHVAFGLAAKDLWWDESLSLQRAEENLWNLLQGVLVIKDGLTVAPTIDQHPFFSFLLQAGVIRVAGNSVYALRFVSAAAATLMAPVLWTFARLLARRQLAPEATPATVVLLTATSPFFLWYGQEARPYALWAMLAMLSTYLLLTALEVREDARWRRYAYASALLCFLATHYYAVFLLPVHALILIVRYWSSNRRVAILATTLLLLVSLATLGFAYWNVYRQGGGGNFPSISLGILLPDLLNAFTLGLSVNIEQVRWLNLLSAALALLGAVWMLRSRKALAAGGWIVPLALVTPIVVLLTGNLFQNLYMNARHMSLIAGPLLLLIAAGVSLFWTRWRWLGGILLLVLLAGSVYSTVNYYTREEYAKDDYSRFGAYLDGRIMPGDAVLFYPPSSWRIFEYYVPLDGVRNAAAEGAHIGMYGVPLLNDDADLSTTFAFLEGLGNDFDRIWVLKSGTHPYYDLDGNVEKWLGERFLRVRDAQFFSQSSLRAQLYLPQVPVVEGDPGALPNATSVEFGENLRLAGYALATHDFPDVPTPVTLYWQVNATPERRYKYLLELLHATEVDGEMVLQSLGSVEREPFEGDIPTLFWDPDRTIIEPIELGHTPLDPSGGAYYLGLQMYDAETLEKLPVSDSAGLETDMDGTRVLLPLDLATTGSTP